MRIVNIGELKNQLSGFLQYVRNGEEIIIRDRSVPVARILPFRQGAGWEQESQLVASGALKMPEEEINWDEFFFSPAGEVSQEMAIQAAIEAGELGEPCFLGHKRASALVCPAEAEPSGAGLTGPACDSRVVGNLDRDAQCL